MQWNDYIKQMNITKNINGSLTISDIIDGYRVAKTYYGYSKKEAINLFEHEFNAHEYIDDALDGLKYLTCNRKGEII